MATRKRTPGLSDFVSNLGQRSAAENNKTQRPSYEPNQQVRDFQPYGAGKPRYGGGRSAPNVGPVTNTEGYKERDLRNRVLKSRTQKLLKNRQKGQVIS